MLLRPLTKLTAALPTSLKLKLGRLRPLYCKIVSFHQRPVRIECHGSSFLWQPDQLTSQTFLNATYEPKMQKAFEQIIRPGFVVYDVGSHAGFHALANALLVGPTGRVIAFEPRESNQISIQKQISLNPELPVQVMPWAVSDHDGTAMFDDSVSSAEGGIRPSGKTVVQTRTIDSLVAAGTIPAPNFIKIDVEGHERQVLRGASETIARHRPVLICDYNDLDTMPAMRETLEPLGYSVTREGQHPTFIVAIPA
jgi:FkbM family methyltransferase